MAIPNPFRDFLEEEPRIAYQAQSDRFGRSPAQANFSRNAFSDVYNQYLGQLGRQGFAGQMPDLRFTDFAQNYDFDENFRNQLPGVRGETQAQRKFVPSLRYDRSRR